MHISMPFPLSPTECLLPVFGGGVESGAAFGESNCDLVDDDRAWATVKFTVRVNSVLDHCNCRKRQKTLLVTRVN